MSGDGRQVFPYKETSHGLTPRQVEVVTLSAGGKTSKEIAHVLGLSKATVDQYIAQAKRRVKVSTKAELTAWAVSIGIAGRP